MTLAEVAYQPRKALQLPVFVLEGLRYDVSPESRPVLLHMPSFVSEMAFGRAPFQFLWNTEAKRVFTATEKRHILPKSFTPVVSIEALGSQIPCRNASAGIHQEQRVVLQPVVVWDQGGCSGMDDN